MPAFPALDVIDRDGYRPCCSVFRKNMIRVHPCFQPIVLGVLIGLGAGCSLVMDADFDKYEARASGVAGDAGAGGTGAGGTGAGGSAGVAGSSGSAGVGGHAGVGGCEQSLVLNEIQTAGVNGPEDEFVEILNTGQCAAALDEVVLAYRSAAATTDHGVTWSGEPGQVIEPWHLFVVAGAGFPNSADALFPVGMSLGANGGGLAIRKDDAILDQLGWGEVDNGFVDVEAAPAPDQSQSIGRFPDGTDTNNNLADFAILSPSPGAANPPP